MHSVDTTTFIIDDTFEVIQDKIKLTTADTNPTYHWWLIETGDEIPLSCISAVYVSESVGYEILSTETRRDVLRQGWHRILRQAVQEQLGTTLKSAPVFSPEGYAAFVNLKGELASESDKIAVNESVGKPFVLSWQLRIMHYEDNVGFGFSDDMLKELAQEHPYLDQLLVSSYDNDDPAWSTD